MARATGVDLAHVYPPEDLARARANRHRRSSISAAPAIGVTINFTEPLSQLIFLAPPDPAGECWSRCGPSPTSATRSWRTTAPTGCPATRATDSARHRSAAVERLITGVAGALGVFFTTVALADSWATRPTAWPRYEEWKRQEWIRSQLLADRAALGLGTVRAIM